MKLLLKKNTVGLLMKVKEWKFTITGAEPENKVLRVLGLTENRHPFRNVMFY
jgi:hypothetical protein